MCTHSHTHTHVSKCTRPVPPQQTLWPCLAALVTDGLDPLQLCTLSQSSHSAFSFSPSRQGCQTAGLLMSWQLGMSLGALRMVALGSSGAQITPLPCAARGLVAPLSLISPKVIPRVNA